VYPTHQVQLTRLATCQRDLLDNGIDASGMDRQKLLSLASEHLDYFQMMLGCDATCTQIMRLFRHLPINGHASDAPTFDGPHSRRPTLFEKNAS
jgi:hypothetical protein